MWSLKRPTKEYGRRKDNNKKQLFIQLTRGEIWILRIKPHI